MNFRRTLLTCALTFLFAGAAQLFAADACTADTLHINTRETDPGKTFLLKFRVTAESCAPYGCKGSFSYSLKLRDVKGNRYTHNRSALFQIGKTTHSTEVSDTVPLASDYYDVGHPYQIDEVIVENTRCELRDHEKGPYEVN